MNDTKPETPPVHTSWDTYWLGAGDAAAFSGGGASHPAVTGFWANFFGRIGQGGVAPRIIDIASGNGAVVECARSASPELLTDFTCLDISDSAIRALESRFPQVKGIVADARSMPLDSSSFDLIVSQFGLEYAGFEAIDEVMRLLDHGGRLALLLHHQNGGIYRQCAASLDAIDSMLDARFIPLAIDMFQAGFRAYESDDIADYEAKMKDFVPALRTMESVMRRHGQDVADGTIIRLYKDVRTIHGKLRNYDPAEVIGWLKRLEDEVRAYAGRVASMCEAALDEDAFRAWCQRLEHHGLRPDRADAIFAGDRMVPLAWALVGNKA